MKTILVTAISGQVGHGILKCLHGYDGQILGTDIGDYPVGIDMISQFFKVPYASESSYILTLLDICKRNNVSHIIPVNEEEIAKVSTNADTFTSIGVTPLVLPIEKFRLCSDKYELPTTLNKYGVNSPKTYIVDEFVPDGSEYIAKLRFSAGSRLVQKFETKSELDAIIKNIDKDIIIQQYIPSPDTEYTVGIFAMPDEIRSITFRRILKNGYSQFIELATEPEFNQLAKTIAVKFGIVGCFNIQLRRHHGKNYVFEINPRISGTVYFRHQLGFEDVRWWLAYVSGERILPYVPQYTKAIGIRESNEKYLMKEAYFPPEE